MNPITIAELLRYAELGLLLDEQDKLYNRDKPDDYIEWLRHERHRLFFLEEHMATQALNMRADLFLIGRKVCMQGTPTFEDEVI